MYRLLSLVAFGLGTTLIAQAAGSSTHTMTVKVIDRDAIRGTLTFSTGAGETRTMRVDTMAATQLRALEAGQTVIVLCRDDGQGAHVAISQFELVNAPAPG